MKTIESNAIAAPVQSGRQTFKHNLANVVEYIERLPVLRPRLVVLDLLILALFLIH
jgi:hypothetical protein